MFAKFHSHLRGGTQITRVLGIPGGYPGIPKTRQPYLEGIPISLGIWVWGYPKHGDTQITVTAGLTCGDLSTNLVFVRYQCFLLLQNGLLFGKVFLWVFSVSSIMSSKLRPEGSELENQFILRVPQVRKVSVTSRIMIIICKFECSIRLR